MTMGRFTGRNAVVTGASRGIGAAIAERLAAEGANVAIVARTVEQHDHLAGSLTETLAVCREYGTRVEAIAADLADADDRARIVPTALDLFDGRIDILVNNAAAAMYHPLLTMPLKRRRIIFEVNVHAPIDLAQAVAPQMIERGEGWIVNLTSASAQLVPGPPYATAGVAATMATYGASKAALDRITNGFAVELDGTGVRINTVGPRAVVKSEGAWVLVGDHVSEDLVEPMEAMVESVVALCECGPERNGHVHVSLDLLAELGRPVMTLDGASQLEGAS
jgi:NAD(P)-dependent dehydrogenase (short-subunit alcohol dehydrogenase family)